MNEAKHQRDSGATGKCGKYFISTFPIIICKNFIK